MATFNVQKGGKFQIDKGITNILVGMGWTGAEYDLDIHAFGCVSLSDGSPSFYNDGSHALTYANKDLKKGPNKSFLTADESMKHNGDIRVGKGDDTEQMMIDFSKLPEQIDQILIFLTIYELPTTTHTKTFKGVESSVRIYDVTAGKDICRFNLQKEFADAISIHVANLVKKDGLWTFEAIGAGSADEDLSSVLGKLS